MKFLRQRHLHSNHLNSKDLNSRYLLGDRLLLTVFLVCFGGSALAQTYPTKPIKLVAPFAPGGITDVMARAVASRLTTELGQPVVVENRAGASGVIGSAAVARAEPDGYTLLMGNISTLGINPAVLKELGYDPVKSFTPVSLVAVQPLIVAVSTQTPANSMAELVALAKAKPGGLFYGTSGSSYQLVTEAFSEALGIKMTHVPFKGSSPAIEAMMSNQINVIFDPFSTIYAQVKAGRVRGLAMTTKNRSDIAPDLPTVSETVLPSFEASSWQGVVAPAGTPPEIINKLNLAIVKILGTQELKEQFAKQGVDPSPTTPKEFGDYIASEQARWMRVAKQAGIQPE